MAARRVTTFFASFSTRIATWTGSHWALFVGAVLVATCLFLFGVDRTNIAISIVTLLMLFILQNTQNRDSAALHAKLDDLIINLSGPRDELAGIEAKSTDEIEELVEGDAQARSSGQVEQESVTGTSGDGAGGVNLSTGSRRSAHSRGSTAPRRLDPRP